MSESTKRRVEAGYCYLDEGIGDEDLIKPNINLSEETRIHGMKANTDNQKTTNFVLGDDIDGINAEDNEEDDGVVLGDDDNETVVDHVSKIPSFPTDENDISFSIKNLIPCIGRKTKYKEKTQCLALINEKEKQMPIDPFRQTQTKLLKKSLEDVISSHKPMETSTRSGGHNPGVIDASFDTLMQSGKTSSENIHTGNIHCENPCGRGYLVHNKDVANRCIDPDQYDFSHPYRGHAVLIVNQTFSLLDTRNGADVDAQKTSMVLQKLGFIIINKKFINLDKQSTLRVLQDAKSANHSIMDSFAFIISSHGNEITNPRNGKKEHVIYCSDDQYIFTNDILDMFSDENCPSLKGKPKLFFIQACRGTKTDPGSKIMVDDRYQKKCDDHNSSHLDGKYLAGVPDKRVMNSEPDACHYRVQTSDEMDAKGFEDISHEMPLVYCHNDYLVMYAIPSGYFAWRSNMDGSWMLHYLWEEVQNYNFRKPCSFLKVLMAVSRKMANRETNVPNNIEKSGMKAIPVVIHQLEKDIVFQEKEKQYIRYTKAGAIERW